MSAETPRTPVGRRRAFLLAVSGLVVLPAGAALAGCGPGQDGTAGAADTPHLGPAAPPAQVALAGDGFTADGPVSPRPVLRATVTDGTLTGITLAGADGTPVAVTTADDGSVTPTDDLDLDTAYTAAATATKRRRRDRHRPARLHDRVRGRRGARQDDAARRRGRRGRHARRRHLHHRRPEGRAPGGHRRHHARLRRRRGRVALDRRRPRALAAQGVLALGHAGQGAGADDPDAGRREVGRRRPRRRLHHR